METEELDYGSIAHQLFDNITSEIKSIITENANLAEESEAIEVPARLWFIPVIVLTPRTYVRTLKPIFEFPSGDKLTFTGQIPTFLPFRYAEVDVLGVFEVTAAELIDSGNISFTFERSSNLIIMNLEKEDKFLGVIVGSNTDENISLTRGTGYFSLATE